MPYEVLMDIACDISKLGPNKVIITGIIQDGLVYNFAYDRVVNNSFITSSEFNGKAYSGTGDVFASIICGMLVQGCEFSMCVEKATRFIHETIKYTSKLMVYPINRMLLEPMLKDLIFVMNSRDKVRLIVYNSVIVEILAQALDKINIKSYVCN